MTTYIFHELDWPERKLIVGGEEMDIVNDKLLPCGNNASQQFWKRRKEDDVERPILLIIEEKNGGTHENSNKSNVN